LRALKRSFEAHDGEAFFDALCPDVSERPAIWQSRAKAHARSTTAIELVNSGRCTMPGRIEDVKMVFGRRSV
jgi:hypothetical protein